MTLNKGLHIRSVILTALLSVLLLGAPAYANNLTVSNAFIASQDTGSKTATVQFKIAWDNSWRDFQNYDSVWIFMKYSTDEGATWNHAILKSSGTNPSGYSGGGPTEMDIIVPLDKKGCFIQRSASGSGSVNNQSIKIVWDYAADDISDSAVKDVSLKVFGIEMVYVPHGSFYAGDNAVSDASFKQGSSDPDPWYIQSENSISVEGAASNGFYYVSASNDGESATGSEFIIASSFPKGSGAFYAMKYEITQGQYADFLNTLSSAQATARYPEQSGNDRYTIAGAYPNYAASRPDRACNYLSWMDLCAYSDWACLRPMTELEFEKMARGSDVFPVNGELAWGSTAITPAASISGNEDGTETVSTAGANCNYANQVFSGGDAGSGPLRAGIFATATSSREQSGAGYYGVMDLSGNVNEKCVSAGSASGRAFQGTNGDGVLSDSGNATNGDWPGYLTNQGVSGASGSGIKGGSWNDSEAGRLAVSNRSKASYASSSRDAYSGGRSVRTAP